MLKKWFTKQWNSQSYVTKDSILYTGVLLDKVFLP